VLVLPSLCCSVYVSGPGGKQSPNQRAFTALPIDTCKGYTAIFISVFGLNRLKTQDCAICVTTFHGKVTTDVGLGWMRGRRSITGKDKYSAPPTPCPNRLWGRVQRPILRSPRLLRRRVKWPQCKTHNSIQCRGCECLEFNIRSQYMTSLVAWSTLHLPFADNYLATTFSLQPCLYCVLILLQGLAAFHECVWHCKERRIK